MNKERKLRELKAIKNSYDIIIHNMNTLLSTLVETYGDFESKEELNKLIEIAQNFNSASVTESNNIIIKMLEL